MWYGYLRFPIANMGFSRLFSFLSYNSSSSYIYLREMGCLLTFVTACPFFCRTLRRERLRETFGLGPLGEKPPYAAKGGCVSNIGIGPSLSVVLWLRFGWYCCSLICTFLFLSWWLDSYSIIRESLIFVLVILPVALMLNYCYSPYFFSLYHAYFYDITRWSSDFPRFSRGFNLELMFREETFLSWLD